MCVCVCNVKFNILKPKNDENKMFVKNEKNENKTMRILKAPLNKGKKRKKRREGGMCIVVPFTNSSRSRFSACVLLPFL